MSYGNTSISGVWKPENNGDGKLLANACELCSAKLSAGSGAAFVSLYDASGEEGATEQNLKWVLDASTQDESSDTLKGLVFKKGVYAVLDQGGGFNPVVCIAKRHYEV